MKQVTFAAVLWCFACGRDGTRTPPIPGDRASAITVEVLNASGRAGDARVGTRLLRREGIDVVYFGNADGRLDATRIVVRRGSAKIGETVRAALGLGRVEIDLDSTKLLDVSVLLGADFALAAARSSLDFHP
jgi:hypothetical protein